MQDKCFTTNEVANTLGVGVSTVKRWMDGGLLHGTKTPGGHRRILLSELKMLAKSGQFPDLKWDRLFEVGLSLNAAASDSVVSELIQAMQAGDQTQVSSLLSCSYKNGMSISSIADDLIAPAMGWVGKEWEKGRMDIYQEHRSSELILAALHELRGQIQSPLPESAPVCVGGTPEGDHYSLGTLLISMVLREEGWNSINFGSNTPLPSLIRSLMEYRPRLAWLSIGYISNPVQFFKEYEEFYKSAERQEVAVVIGGIALTETVLSRLIYTFHGTRMSHLVAFARSLHKVPQRPRRGRPTNPGT